MSFGRLERPLNIFV